MLDHHPELEASISVDETGYQEITYEATGIQTYKVNSTESAAMHAACLEHWWQTRSMRRPEPLPRSRNCVFPQTPMTTFPCDQLSMREALRRSMPSFPQPRSVLISIPIPRRLEKLRDRIFASPSTRHVRRRQTAGASIHHRTEVKHICDVNTSHQDSHASHRGRSHGGGRNSLAVQSRSLETAAPPTATGPWKPDFRLSVWRRL